MLSPGQLLKGAFIMFAAGIPVRIGHRYPFPPLTRGARGVSWFLTHSIDEQPNLHDIEQNLNLLKLVDRSSTNYSLPTTNYSLTVPLSNQSEAEKLIQTLAIPGTKRLLGLHPGSAKGFGFKRWPLENFAELAKHFVNKNYHILIFGGPEEAELKEKLVVQIQAKSPPPYQGGEGGGRNVTIISHKSLLTTAAIMQKCELFVSNDSGLMHLAAAAGVKTYGLFGPTDEALTGPRGRDSHIIRASGTKPVYQTETTTLATNQALRALTPQNVIDKTEEAL